MNFNKQFSYQGNGGGKIYATPLMEVIDLQVENGFASSGSVDLLEDYPAMDEKEWSF